MTLYMYHAPRRTERKKKPVVCVPKRLFGQIGHVCSSDTSDSGEDSVQLLCTPQDRKKKTPVAPPRRPGQVGYRSTDSDSFSEAKENLTARFTDVGDPVQARKKKIHRNMYP